MSQENVVLARKVVSAFNRRDVPALVELTTDDFEWVTWTGTVEPTVYHGADGLAGYFRDSDVWEILTLDVQEFRDLGDKLVVVRHVSCTRWGERRRGPRAVLLGILREGGKVGAGSQLPNRAPGPRSSRAVGVAGRSQSQLRDQVGIPPERRFEAHAVPLAAQPAMPRIAVGSGPLARLMDPP